MFSSLFGTFFRIDHVRPQEKSEQVEEDWYHTKHLFHPQQYETKNKLQEVKENYEKYKHVDTKHHAIKHPMGDLKHQRENQKIP